MSSEDPHERHTHSLHRQQRPPGPVDDPRAALQAAAQAETELGAGERMALNQGEPASGLDSGLASVRRGTATEASGAQKVPERRSTSQWLLAGWVSAGLWPSAWSRHIAQGVPTAAQLLALLCWSTVLGLGLMWSSASQQGEQDVVFSATGMLWSGWSLLAGAIWLAVLVRWQGWRGAQASQRLAAGLALSLGGLVAAALWWLVLGALMQVLDGKWPEVAAAWAWQVSPWVAAGLAASALGMSAWVALRRSGALLLGCLGFAAIMAVAVTLTPFMPWLPADELQVEGEAGEGAEGTPAPRQLVLTQTVFENQQRAFTHARHALVPRDPARINLYGIVFAPYAGENVFRNEARLLNEVLSSRFEAQGRVLTLLNHVDTANTTPWATAENLRRAVQAVAEVMDKERDLFFIYMTSHGGRDHKLAGDFGPLSVPPLDASVLRSALDEAGIRHRVVVVSACYSGGWVPPMQSNTTLVMTAADADHTSYGCGHLSELTYFGRALFDEQLRTTRSFETAFQQAVPIIKQREIEGGKDDGFSNPQLSMGQDMGAFLKRFEAQWP